MRGEGGVIWRQNDGSFLVGGLGGGGGGVKFYIELFLKKLRSRAQNRWPMLT